MPQIPLHRGGGAKRQGGHSTNSPPPEGRRKAPGWSFRKFPSTGGVARSAGVVNAANSPPPEGWREAPGWLSKHAHSQYNHPPHYAPPHSSKVEIPPPRARFLGCQPVISLLSAGDIGRHTAESPSIPVPRGDTKHQVGHSANSPPPEGWREAPGWSSKRVQPPPPQASTNASPYAESRDITTPGPVLGCRTGDISPFSGWDKTESRFPSPEGWPEALGGCDTPSKQIHTCILMWEPGDGIEA